ncbi:hypothetical protein HMPREF9104_02451, partial [Lentilactobacillus kisonensis F0435]
RCKSLLGAARFHYVDKKTKLSGLKFFSKVLTRKLLFCGAVLNGAKVWHQMVKK